MIKNKASIIITVIFAFLVTGCSISKNVKPVDSGTTISKVFIEQNEKVLMEGLLGEVENQIRGLGFEAETYIAPKPPEARHHMTFTANWRWDMAMYLVYFRATLYEDDKFIGQVEYDAHSGGMNMSKFGKTADKIKPLLTELFENVNRGGTVNVLGE